MDNSFHSQGSQTSDTKEASGFLASLQIFDRIESWLAGLFELSEVEREDAGIRLDDQHQG
jgi:hypothetical protein